MLQRVVALGLSILILAAAGIPGHAQTQTNAKPFIMPVLGESGPSTWTMGQPYGNTTGAFSNGANNYAAGQYLHFGIDISMPCGTPVVAIGNGVVHSTDNTSRGSAPHNLLIEFPELGLTVLYGHLLERPALARGEIVQQGQVVALSGDPDLTCDSRPHLHLEIRSLDHRTAYNPIDYIEAPWHSLVGLGAMSRPLFQRDLMNARRWMSLEDQPIVQFGGARLNNYRLTWPIPSSRRAGSMTLPLRLHSPISREWTLRQVGINGCCPGAWWHPSSPQQLFMMDGAEAELASVFEVIVGETLESNYIQPAPPMLTSADGTLEVLYEDRGTRLRRLSDGTEWFFEIPGVYPILSPNNQLALWTLGEEQRQLWVTSLDNTIYKRVWNRAARNLSARWLDDAHLLLSERAPGEGRYTTLHVLNIHDESSYTLGTFHNLRSMQIAPGGQRLILFSSFNPDPALDGAFLIEIEPGATAQKLDWFADYRWRDAESVFYITFDSATDIQQLHYYHVLDGVSYALTDPETMPFTIANGDWSVSADGNKIAFQEARDGNLWVLEAGDVPVSNHSTP